MPTLKSLFNLLTHPARIPERLSERRMYAQAMAYYQRMDTEAIDSARINFFQQDIHPIIAEAEASDVYQNILHMRQGSPIVASQTTGLVDCVTMYIVIRLFKPRIMVETGVFYGGMSAMILEAMKRNGEGALYSIDLPIESDGLGELRGSAVPPHLRSNWHLILGDSRVELPKLLRQLGKIDIFNHDSLHTTAHMLWEYETAWDFINPGGLLTSHDVLVTPAWKQFMKAKQAQITRAGHIYGIGIAIKS